MSNIIPSIGALVSSFSETALLLLLRKPNSTHNPLSRPGVSGDVSQSHPVSQGKRRRNNEMCVRLRVLVVFWEEKFYWEGVEEVMKFQHHNEPSSDNWLWATAVITATGECGRTGESSPDGVHSTWWTKYIGEATAAKTESW